MKEKIFKDKHIIDQQWCGMERKGENYTNGIVLTIAANSDVIKVLISYDELQKAAAEIIPPNEYTEAEIQEMIKESGCKIIS